MIEKTGPDYEKCYFYRRIEFFLSGRIFSSSRIIFTRIGNSTKSKTKVRGGASLPYYCHVDLKPHIGNSGNNEAIAVILGNMHCRKIGKFGNFT
jgi:hypothetical protein